MASLNWIGIAFAMASNRLSGNNVQRMRLPDAAVAVKYDGDWFYIEETDLDSKSTFNLLLELFKLQIRAGGNAQIPLLTI